MAQYKKEDIRKKILENAKAEFLELGYKNASVASIARKSQIGVGNVYRYFKNKEAILDAIVTPVVERIKKTLIADTDYNDVNNHENILNIISEIMKEINDLSINYKEEIIIVLQGCETTKYFSIKEEIICSLSFEIKKFIEKRLEDKISKINIELAMPISVALIEGSIRIILTSIKNNGEDNYEQLYVFARTILEGLIITTRLE